MSALTEIDSLRKAGFTDQEVSDWGLQKRQELSDAGFGQGEIDTYFGSPPFDPKPIKAHVEESLQRATQPTTEGGQPKPVTDFVEAFKAGFGESSMALLAGKPETTVASDAPRSSRIASQVGTLLGDIPAMGAGFAAGGFNPITGTAGAFALPAGIRKIMMDKYEKGEVAGFGDFWDRFSGAFIDTAKGWITGAATGAVGKAIGMAPIASPTAKAAATLTGEIGTMVTVGSALEGHVPEPNDFVDAAIALGFIKGSAKIAGKLRNIYAETGVKPDELVQDIQRDPTILHDLASEDVTIPKVYEPSIVTEPVKPVSETQAAVFSDAQKAILERVVLKDPKTAGMTLSDVYTSMVDNLNPILKVMKEGGKADLEVADSPYMLERLTRGIAGKASEFLNHGAFDFETFKTTTKGYFQILDPVKKDLDGFRAYIVSKRAVELSGKGIETGIPIEEAKATVKQDAGKYQAIHDARIEYRNAMLDTLQKSGILSKDAVAGMREAHKDYVPFYRFFEDANGRPLTAMEMRNPVKGIKGSERQILDPIISDIKDTFLFVALAEKNAARQAFVKLGPEFAEKIEKKAPQKEAITTESGEPVNAMAEIARTAATEGKGELAVYVNGTRQLYKVDPKVAEAFNGLDSQATSLLAKIAYAPASLLRAGVTITPDFIMRNMMRDAVSSFIYAGSNPIKTLLGAKSIITKDTAFHNWMKGGGANATLVAIDRNYLAAQIGELNAQTGLMRRAWNVATSPLDILRATSELIENSTRVGAVRSELLQAKSKAQIQALSMIAREATVDFARHGRDTQPMAKSTAFFNPAIQGIDRFAREAKAHPIGMTAKAIASVTLPSVLLWYANRDDEEIQDAPRWQKDLFWMTRVPLPDGKSFIMRIPKPQEFGILFGTVPERLLDAFVAEHPDAMRDIGKSMLDAFTPSLVPTAAVPIISQFANRDTFRGHPLIPANLEGILPEYQYTPYTTELAKAMGQIIGAFPGMEPKAIDKGDPFLGGMARALSTPILVETYVRDWTGGMGMYLFQLADKALREAGALPDPVKPAATLSDIPFVRAFTVRYPSATAQSIQDFYEDFDKSKVYFDTIMKLANDGDPRAAGLIDQHSEDLAQLSGIRETLTQQSQIISMVNKNPEMPPDEKRQLIDTLYYRMIEISQAGNAALRQLKTVQK